jgi:uncharacterized protein (DUF3820 family)
MFKIIKFLSKLIYNIMDSETLTNYNIEKKQIKKNIDFDFMNSNITFGKHKGTKFIDLPKSYMKFLIEKNIIKDKKIQLSYYLDLIDLSNAINLLKYKMQMKEKYNITD